MDERSSVFAWQQHVLTFISVSPFSCENISLWRGVGRDGTHQTGHLVQIVSIFQPSPKAEIIQGSLNQCAAPFYCIYKVCQCIFFI